MARWRSRKNCSRISERRRLSRHVGIFFGCAPEKIELAGIGGGGFLGGRGRQPKAEPIREPQGGVGRKTFERICHESPDAPGFRQRSLCLLRPALQGGLAVPKKIGVA